MKTLSLILTLLAAGTLLAGCSDAPPSGELSAVGHMHPLSGTAMITYQAAHSPADETSGQDIPVDCAPEAVPLSQLHCIPPSTNVTLHFMALPEPLADGYRAFLVGQGQAEDLGALTPGNGTMYDLQAMLDQDASAWAEHVEVRMGDFVYGTAPAMDGENDFAVREDVLAVRVEGTYRGKELTFTVSGLPLNATFNGYLYELDEAGMLHQVEEFPGVANGENTLTAQRNIASYAEFHIHVGSSAINLWKGDFGL